VDLEDRPELSGSELLRWYWTAEELTRLARARGRGTGGGKQALAARLAAPLDGGPEPAADARRRPAGAAQLAGPVGVETVIPAGQRCSQVLRAFFQEQIGPALRFDAFMRDFIAGGAGRTLGDAVRHWHATREAAVLPQPIGDQFEFNRFVRDWHRRHPAGTRSEALAAWHRHRSAPR
jgi:hypothetical protein